MGGGVGPDSGTTSLRKFPAGNTASVSTQALVPELFEKGTLEMGRNFGFGRN